MTTLYLILYVSLACLGFLWLCVSAGQTFSSKPSRRQRRKQLEQYKKNERRRREARTTLRRANASRYSLLNHLNER